MSDITEALYEKLSTTAGLTSLVSTRIYPDLMPQSPTLPAVTYQMISNVREERHRGQTGDSRPRFQLTCWAATALAAAAVAAQVRLAVMAMSGTIESVVISGVWNAGESRGYEPDTQRYFAAVDVFVAHKEAVA
jgi:hypothetical protein